MPRVVDHGERREELAGAVWRVIRRDGIEGVSIRTVAAEAGLSTGALRHYFATKEELLAGADRLLAGRVIRRLKRRPGDVGAREGARAAVLEVLPLDEERRTEAAVWFAFTGRSLVDGRVSREHRSVFDGTRELCHRVVQDLDAAGELAWGLNPESETRRLHVLIDGLVVQALMGRLGAEEMLGVLDAHLDEISGRRGP